MEEPLINRLILVSKKYISAFSVMVDDLPIERYQYVLVLIEENNEKLTQKALSELLNIDKSYMVSIIDYLSAKGYVFRERNAEDRREQIIRLTDNAKKDLPLIKNAFNELNLQSFKGLSKKQISDFDEILMKIQDNLNNSNASEIIFDIKRSQSRNTFN